MEPTQPGRDFLGLERQFTGAKIAIDQLRNFFRRAWLSDLVQRSQQMFFETAVRLRYLSKVRLSRLKVSLMGAAHTVRNVKGAPEPSRLAIPVYVRLPAAENRKGCDIGYALAISSCEEANSMEACTIAALDVITAFAVPNPNGSSQSQSVFSGLVALGVAPSSGSPSLLRTGKFY